jgi:hypothetical protein
MSEVGCCFCGCCRKVNVVEGCGRLFLECIGMFVGRYCCNADGYVCNVLVKAQETSVTTGRLQMRIEMAIKIER